MFLFSRKTARYFSIESNEKVAESTHIILYSKDRDLRCLDGKSRNQPILIHDQVTRQNINILTFLSLPQCIHWADN